MTDIYLIAEIRLRKMRRKILILLFPVIVFLWMIGWSMFVAGSSSKSRKPKIDVQADNVTIIAAPLEEDYLIESEN